MLTHIAGLDIADIFTQFLKFLTGEIIYLTSTCTFCHVKAKALTLHSLIAIGRRIEIGKLHRRYLILSLMTWNHQHIVDHRPLDTA